MKRATKPARWIGLALTAVLVSSALYGQQPENQPPQDATGHEAAPTHFTNATFAGATTAIYRGTRNPRMFLATPACLLAADPAADSATPIPWVRRQGRVVELQLVNATEAIRTAQLAAINNELKALGEPETSPEQIGLLYLNRFVFTVTNDDLAEHVAPYFLPADSRPANIQLDAVQTIVLKCDGDESARELEARLRDPHQAVHFRIQLVALGSRYEGFEIEITGRQLAQTAAFNSILPTGDKTVPVAVSQEQLAGVTRQALNELNITITADASMAGQAISPADVMALVDRFQRQISVDFQLALDRASDATQLYIDGESFAPDRIHRESQKLSESLTQAANSAIDTFEERIRLGERLPNLPRPFPMRMIGSLPPGVVNPAHSGERLDFVMRHNPAANSPLFLKLDPGLEVEMDRRVSEQIQREGSAENFTRFSDSARHALHREMARYFNRASTLECEWDGERIVPRRVNLRRIVRENLETAGRLYFSRRTRIVSADAYQWDRSDEPRYLAIALPTALESLQRELQDYRQRYEHEIDDLIRRHAADLSTLREKHQTDLAELQSRYRAEMTELRQHGLDAFRPQAAAALAEMTAELQGELLAMRIRNRGYTWLREESFSCGGQTHTMQVYRCDKFAQLVNARTESRNGKQFCDVDCEFVLIPAGEFMMGCPANESGRVSDEGPRHRVRIAKPFLMARTEVSQRVWQAVMGNNPAYFKNGANGAPADSSRLPVEGVSWDDVTGANGFIVRAGVTGLRLPSESEWEYACRAGTTTPFTFGENISPAQVNYNGDYPYRNAAKGEYRGKPVAVGSLPANAFGLFEMHGNVWEWCQDDWQGDYNGAPADGSAREITGASNRVLRGGSWGDEAVICRSAYRYRYEPDRRYWHVGFRPVQTLSN